MVASIIPLNALDLLKQWFVHGRFQLLVWNEAFFLKRF